jgi:hypothetical protein
MAIYLSALLVSSLLMFMQLRTPAGRAVKRTS